jgi:iron complex transport system substrate-binding protein
MLTPANPLTRLRGRSRFVAAKARLRLGSPALAFFLVTILAFPALAAPPQRIVSINLCTDELVVPLADRTAIKSVSYLAADPQESPIADEVKGIPVNYARAEEILPLKPDVVFANAFSAAYTVSLLRRLGVRVVELPEPTDFDGIRANIRRVADILGKPEKGAALIEKFDRSLRETVRKPGPNRPSAVIYRAGGYTDGGIGLVSALLAHVGLRNVALEHGLDRWSHLSIEQLLLDKPDIIVFSAYERETPSQESAVLEHPAIRDYLATHRSLGIPPKYWGCGTPVIAKVAKSLARLADQGPAK